VDLRPSAEDEAFRKEVREWLEDNLAGDFAEIRFRGGPGDEDVFYEERRAWERRLAQAGWTCIGWPAEHGGRDLSLDKQVIFYEEYARAGGPGRVGHMGETLAGPTIIAFGTEEQKRRFLPPIRSGDELWCQGYSEPNAGSDLANVSTFAELDGDEWVINGQKVWTSLSHWADWCFVVVRTSRDKPRHKGLSFLLVPMRQDGVTLRPIEQMTGDSEFSETFFDDARTQASNIVGEVDGGWQVAMTLLSFERGASTLGQQLNFQNELDRIVEAAKRNGKAQDPATRQRLVDAWTGLRIMRFNTLRVLSEASGAAVTPEGMIAKLYWASWHRKLGELAMDVLGAEALLTDAAVDGRTFAPTSLQRLFLFSRSDTIYGGSNQIQRNIIGERALGLPKEPTV